MLKKIILLLVLILLVGCKDKEIYDSLEGKYSTMSQTPYSSYDTYIADATALRTKLGEFLDKYPKSKFYAEVNSRFTTLTGILDSISQEKEEYATLKASYDKVSVEEEVQMLQRFLDKYPNSIKVNEVNQKLLDKKYEEFQINTSYFYDIKSLNYAIKLCDDFIKIVEGKSNLYKEKALEEKNNIENARNNVFVNEIYSKIEDFSLSNDASIRAEKVADNYMAGYDVAGSEANYKKMEVEENKVIFHFRIKAWDSVGIFWGWEDKNGEHLDEKPIQVVYEILGGNLDGVQGFKYKKIVE